MRAAGCHAVPMSDLYAPLKELLMAHDWTYEMSDDPWSYKRGHDQRMAILAQVVDMKSYALALAFAAKVPSDLSLQDRYVQSLSRRLEGG